MKTALVLLVASLSTLPTFAFAKVTTSFSNRQVLLHVLSSEELSVAESTNQLGELQSTEVSKSGQGIAARYEVRLTYRAPGLGPNGPDSRPCFLQAEVEIDVVKRGHQNVTVSELSAPKLSEAICAQNAPRN